MLLVFIVDCFEGEQAVIEYGDKTFNLPRVLLPESVHEGDVLIIEIKVDLATTEKRKNEAEDLLKGFFDE